MRRKRLVLFSDTRPAEVFRYYMPGEEEDASTSGTGLKLPTTAAYLLWDPDYVTVKRRGNSTADGAPVDGIRYPYTTAVDTLRLPNTSPILQEQLK
jgi:hypothetical protein